MQRANRDVEPCIDGCMQPPAAHVYICESQDTCTVGSVGHLPHSTLHHMGLHIAMLQGSLAALPTISL
jgi:hypothetical protein